jgi:branched-chain amino acid transport system substrate-binding protein
VAKIRASSADSIITGNWGNDFTLLVKAAKDAGLPVDYYTYYAGAPGMLTVLGEGALGRIKNVSVAAGNPFNERNTAYVTGYRDKYKEDLILPQPGMVIEMLALAIDRARSTDPEKVARALIQPLFIDSVAKVDGKEIKIDWDHSGMGWKTERRIEGKDTIMPTICKMERPQ